MMKKLLNNTIALTAFLTLSTVALPVFAVETSLPEVSTEEILIAQRSRRYRFNRTHCVNIRSTRRWLYQRCSQSTCLRRGRRGRVRCRVVKNWERRIPRRYNSRIIWRR